MAPRFLFWIVRYIWRSDQLSEVESELKRIWNQVCSGFSHLMCLKPSALRNWLLSLSSDGSTISFLNYQVHLKIRSIIRSGIRVETDSKSGLWRIFIPDVLETLCSPKLTFQIQLRWLYDFLPGLSGTFEDQISFQKQNQSWNEFEIRFVQDFLTWCTPNPLLTIAGRSIWARQASIFCTYSN